MHSLIAPEVIVKLMQLLILNDLSLPIQNSAQVHLSLSLDYILEQRDKRSQVLAFCLIQVRAVSRCCRYCCSNQTSLMRQFNGKLRPSM